MDKCFLCGQAFSMRISVLYVESAPHIDTVRYSLFGQVCSTWISVLYVDRCTLWGQVNSMWKVHPIETGILYVD